MAELLFWRTRGSNTPNLGVKAISGDNVSYFVEQVDSANVSTYHYRVIFKPDQILPYIDLQTQIGK